ncbi:MAG: T9SS type A sorting domain-containing protein [Flavobacteriales bacterium]|nr:T9SS type A sorting domain-containing protein [Flavobacteriales bacterium]
MSKHIISLFITSILLLAYAFPQFALEGKSSLFKKNTFNDKTGGIDTLNRDTVFAKQGSVYLYKNSGGGYVFGTSKINGQAGFTQIAQKQINSGNLDMVTEVLIWFGIKKEGNTLSSIDVSVRSILPNSATGGELPNGTIVEGPGNIIGDVSQIPFSAIDTSSLGLIFTTIPIANAKNITGNFFIQLDFTNCYANADSVGIWADKNGDGFLGSYSKFGNTWYQTNTAYQNSLDVNMAVFAVVEESNSIKKQTYFNGIKLHLYPNPVKNKMQVEIATEVESENLSIEIIDLNGRIVYSNQVKHNHHLSQQIEMDVSNLKAGTYYISVYGNNTTGRITKKFIKQ